MKNYNTTQLDYIKILMEEHRDGEALNMLKKLSSELESQCILKAQQLNNTELEMPKYLVSTKPNNWIFLKETWFKIIDISKDKVHLEISDGISIKNTIKIK